MKCKQRVTQDELLWTALPFRYAAANLGMFLKLFSPLLHHAFCRKRFFSPLSQQVVTLDATVLDSCAMDILLHHLNGLATHQQTLLLTQNHRGSLRERKMMATKCKNVQPGSRERRPLSYRSGLMDKSLQKRNILVKNAASRVGRGKNGTTQSWREPEAAEYTDSKAFFGFSVLCACVCLAKFKRGEHH